MSGCWTPHILKIDILIFMAPSGCCTSSACKSYVWHLGKLAKTSWGGGVGVLLQSGVLRPKNADTPYFVSNGHYVMVKIGILTFFIRLNFLWVVFIHRKTTSRFFLQNYMFLAVWNSVWKYFGEGEDQNILYHKIWIIIFKISALKNLH